MYSSYITIFTYPNINLHLIDRIISTNLKVKICGETPIKRPQYLGKLPTLKDKSDALKSASIFIDDGQNAPNASMLSTKVAPLYFFPAKSSFDNWNISYNIEEERQKAINNTYFHVVGKMLREMGQLQLSEQVINRWKTLNFQLR
jgi:hypothetical protein